jgi:Protein of unknown function (DUF2491)
MRSKTAFFPAALIAVLVVAPLGVTTSAVADSGGYRRPLVSAPYASGWSSSPSRTSGGGYRRPSTYGSGYVPRSGGDLSVSRTTSAQALQQYRALQQQQQLQQRRPPVSSPESDWAGSGYTSRRPPTYAQPMNMAGGFGSPSFWAMLAALSAVDRAAYFRQSQYDPAYQQWRQQAVRDPGTASRLAQLGDQAAGQPANAAAPAPSTSSGSGIVWIVLFIGGAVFVLLWVARRRATSGPATGAPAGLTGTSATRFRVGQTIPLDPAPFLLAAGATKVKPPTETGMISVEAIGLLEDAGVQLNRLYLPGRTAFFQLHLGGDGTPDECRYFSRLDEVQPASQSEWGEWLDPAQGMIGWPAFQTKDGQTYDRAWAPGQTKIPPRQQIETVQALGGMTRRQLQTMLYARATGAAPPAPSTEYAMVAAVQDGGQAWVEIFAGIDVNPASLNLPSVSP